MNRDFVTTRSAGLERLAEMVPGCGLDYAARRNLDTGPLGEATTTGLSPYLRRRLLLEQEVVAAALAKHGAGKATKFVEEVFLALLLQGFPRDTSRDLDQLPGSRGTGEGRIRHIVRRKAGVRSKPWPDAPGSTVSMTGRESSWRPDGCTTTCGCGSPRSGSSPWGFPGRSERISSCATSSTAIRPATHCRGDGSQDCTRAANPMPPGPRTSGGIPTAATRRPA